MKKILLLLSFIITGVVLFSSCDPTKDYVDEYTKYNDPSKVKLPDSTTVFALASTDYAASSVTAISTSKNFTDANPANPNLLEILNKKYNAKIGASVTFTYAYSNPLTFRDSTVYTMLNADYGNTKYYFTKATDLTSYLVRAYPTATRGKVVVLTYNWYVYPTTSVLTNTFVCLSDQTWIQANPAFVLADYNTMMQAYADFASSTDALFYIPIYLKNKYPYAKTGDNIMVQWDGYVSGKYPRYLLLLTYNGTSWTAFNPLSTANIVANFDGTAWKFLPRVVFSTVTPPPTNAIPYTLISDDYKLVNGANAYSDFDRRVGYPENNDNVFLTKMGTILRARFTITPGEVYAVTYADYAGTITNKTVYLLVVK